MSDAHRGSRAVPGYFLYLQTPSLLCPRLERQPDFFTFPGKFPGGGSCGWAAPSQGGGEPAFSFSKPASPSGLWGKYYVSILSCRLLTWESPGNRKQAFVLSMPSDSPFHASALCQALCWMPGPHRWTGQTWTPPSLSISSSELFPPWNILKKIHVEAGKPQQPQHSLLMGLKMHFNSVVYPKESVRQPTQTRYQWYKINTCKQQRL